MSRRLFLLCGGAALVLLVLVGVLLVGTTEQESGPLNTKPASSSVPISTEASVVAGEDFCVGSFCMSGISRELSRDGVKATLASLRDAMVEDPARSGRCHQIAHEIGREAVRLNPNLTELLEADDGGCLYGYQHGVLEGWSQGATLEQLKAGLPTACDPYVKVGGYAMGSCTHGLGHAISLQEVGPLLDAVALCDILDEGWRPGCAGGVFMAYSSTSASQGELAPKVPLSLTKKEVDTACETVGVVYRPECYQKLWLLGGKVGYDLLDVAKICEGAGENLSVCGIGVGTGFHYQNNLEASTALQKCDEIAASVRGWCQVGVGWSSANSWVGNNESAASYKSVCSGAAIEFPSECVKREQDALQGDTSSGLNSNGDQSAGAVQQ